MKKMTENQKVLMNVLSANKEKVLTAKEISVKSNEVIKSRGIASCAKALIENGFVQRFGTSPVGYQFIKEVVLEEEIVEDSKKEEIVEETVDIKEIVEEIVEEVEEVEEIVEEMDIIEEMEENDRIDEMLGFVE